MTRTFFRVLAALAIVSALGLAPAAAQTGQTFGEVVGKVTDDQGGVLPGVTVTLSGPSAMGNPTAVSGTNGIYRFPAVNTGTSAPYFASGAIASGRHGLSGLTANAETTPINARNVSVCAMYMRLTCGTVSPRVTIGSTGRSTSGTWYAASTTSICSSAR